MKRSLLIVSICLLLGSSLYGQVARDLKGLFDELPYCGSIDDIYKYCKDNNYTVIANTFDSTLSDYNKTYIKGLNFWVDIATHTIDVKWVFNFKLGEKDIKKAFILSRTYFFTKQPEYPQEKCDTYLKELFESYVSDYVKNEKRFYRSEIVDPGGLVVGEHAIYNYRKYKGIKYYLEIVKMNNTITKNLIRDYSQ